MKRMLPALLKLLLVLAAVSRGTATFCDITENKAQCYGALGQSVSIYPLNTSFDIVALEVFFQSKEFFRYREKSKTSSGTCQNRCQLMKNRTLRLDRVMKSDSGIYDIVLFNEEGFIKLRRNISLTIQDPVSRPALSQLCLSHGEIGVSCSSTGEDPQYSWTLDDRPLDGGVALLSNETQTVILRRNVSGSITCTASNRVSSERTTQELLKCPGTATSCDITETKTLVQCYGALGQSVSIYPLNTSFKIEVLQVFFQGKEFFRYREKTKTSGGTCQNRCQFITTGTLSLDNVTKSDSGIYTIMEFDENGITMLRKNVSLTIPGPVSPPALSQLCLSHGEIRASCSSTGDDPQYSWTLDNSPLDGGVAFLSDETHTVILRRNVSGSITCTASNRVSSEHTTQELLKCPDPVSPPALSQLCLSHGEIRASCNSTGEDPQYSWTLNNSTLDGGVAFLSNETHTVILRRNVSGSITCTASNHVSSENTTQELHKCPGLGAPVICTLGNGTEIEVRMNALLNASSLLDNTEISFRAGWAEMVSAVCTSRPQQTPLTCGFPENVVLPVALGVCLLLMVLLLGTCCLYKKKQKQAKTSQSSAGDRCEDPQELVYCQVQVVRKKERPKKQEQDPQVVYAEVKVSGDSKAVRRTPNEQADTIYSGIRT